MSPFFWLHIKKSAGISTRKLMQPHYVEVDRTRRPCNFIQATRSQHNDILNNYRVVLGEYQFRRAQFARDFLYPETWATTCSFAFSREPVSRAVSMFHYLYLPERSRDRLRPTVRNFVRTGALNLTARSAFDQFLDLVEEAHGNSSIFEPIDLHFTTHTARMWEDVTDETGKVLLSHVFRLDDLVPALNAVFLECGITKRLSSDDGRQILNKRKHRTNSYEPTQRQNRHIQRLFGPDFALFEDATRVFS